MCVYRRAEANFDDLNPTRLMESSNLLEDRFPLIFFLFDGIWRRRRFLLCLVCFTVQESSLSIGKRFCSTQIHREPFRWMIHTSMDSIVRSSKNLVPHFCLIVCWKVIFRRLLRVCVCGCVLICLDPNKKRSIQDFKVERFRLQDISLQRYTLVLHK